MRHATFTGGDAAPIDFDMLRVGLAATQAATPTAIASDAARPLPSPHEALITLFGELGRDLDALSALRGCFAPSHAAPSEEGDA